MEKLNFKYFKDKEFLKLFHKFKDEHGIDFLANKFSLNNSTIIRWVNKNSVPPQYHFDLISLTKNEENILKYIKIISARNKNQFSTKPNVAVDCFN